MKVRLHTWPVLPLGTGACCLSEIAVIAPHFGRQGEKALELAHGVREGKVSRTWHGRRQQPR